MVPASDASHREEHRGFPEGKAYLACDREPAPRELECVREISFEQRHPCTRVALMQDGEALRGDEPSVCLLETTSRLRKIVLAEHPTLFPPVAN